VAQLTAAQLRQVVSDSLEKSTGSLDPDQKAELAEATSAQLIALAAPPAEGKRRLDPALFNSNVVYAVPDEALNLIPSLVQAVVGAFSNGPAGALGDLVGILVRYRSLKVELTAEEAAVVSVLRTAKVEKSPPLAPAQITERLTKAKLTLKQPLGAVLASLLAKKTDQTTPVREADGRWTVGNV
jgi:hypothetical protein